MDIEMEKNAYERTLAYYIPSNIKRYQSGDINGVRGLIDDYLYLAGCEYGLFNNQEACKQNLEKYKYYAELELEKRKELDLLWFSATVFEEQLVVLSTGDEKFFIKYLKFIDDNADYDEKPSKHGAPWTYRAIAWMVLGRNIDKIEDAISRAKLSFHEHGKYKAMYPYIMMLEAIWEKDEVKFHKFLQMAADKYSRQRIGTFSLPYQTFIAYEALGWCQLAKFKGLKVDFDHKFIPRFLIENS